MTLKTLLEVTCGQVLSSHKESFSGVGVDTRQDLWGKLFVALRGENFDGHDYLPQAQQAGAHIVLIDQGSKVEDFLDKLTVVKVDNTLKALQALAGAYRKSLKAKVIGITGSNGKTTTKEFTYHLLKESKRCIRSLKSFNNHLGVPLTILSADESTEVLIAEVGMNHPGEIKELCEIACPDVVLANNVSCAHQGAFLSEEEIAKEKEQIYRSSSLEVVRVFNLDNFWTKKMYEKFRGFSGDRKNGLEKNILCFSSQDKASNVCLEIKERQREIFLKGHIGGVKGEISLEITGKHNGRNIMAALTLALAVGADPKSLWKALKNCKLPPGRAQWLEIENKGFIFYDAYNANPKSMECFLKVIEDQNCQGPKGLVLGEMVELGKFSSSYHEKLGALVARIKPDWVWFVGDKSREPFKKGLGESCDLITSSVFDSQKACELEKKLKPQGLIGIKGSRKVALERVLECWMGDAFNLKSFF